MKVSLSNIDAPFGALFACGHSNVSFVWGKFTSVTIDGVDHIVSSQSLSRHIARTNPSSDLYPSDILHRTEVDHWLTFSCGPLSCSSDITSLLNQLNNALAPSAFLTANKLTIADYEVFAALFKSKQWHVSCQNKSAPVHVLRWYNHIHKKVEKFLTSLPTEISAKPIVTSTETKSINKEDGGKFIELPDAKMGEVVVRFPPEASGYLHIGHAKAALLNQYYQKTYKGKLIMRFDDTNPAKEKANFEKVILEDLKLLQVEPDRFTHTSDYFDYMIEMCEKLLKDGNAYVDDTDPEMMKKEREERKDSKNRNNVPQKNIEMFKEMKAGTDFGLMCCVRAKIDMTSDNGCLRDPTIYRCKSEPHVKTGTKYKVYPTYDFACPIVDSIEGVTHALRTTEYHDRDDQFYWFIKAMGLRSLHIYEYSRLNMNNTVLSKRKLTWFVEEGLVDGWDDARMPTVRGILRKGMTVEGLKDFIIAQGSSRSVVNMEWDKIWAFNKKVIDRDAPRYTALEGPFVTVNVKNAQEGSKEAQKHPKDPSKGMKTVWTGPKILIEAVDAALLEEGQNATFINWGNLKIVKINKKNDEIINVEAETNLSNVDFKKTLKLTWMADTTKCPSVPVVCVYFEQLMNKAVLGKEENFKDFIASETRRNVRMIGDNELKSLKSGDIIQLQRKGFFRVDEPYKTVSAASCQAGPVVLFSIPDGHRPTSKELPTVSAKEAKQNKKGKVAEKSPQDEVKTFPSSSNSTLDIHSKIVEQGNIIRKLKSNKAEKSEIMTQVDVLKTLKVDFKKSSGTEWKPDIDVSQFSTSLSEKTVVQPSEKKSAAEIHSDIVSQGDKIRLLKNEKAEKSVIISEVGVLKSLKSDFKVATSIEWKPDIDMSQFDKNVSAKIVATEEPSSTSVAKKPTELSPLKIHFQIKTQGDIIRLIKEEKAEKSVIVAQVDILKSLKSDFKNLTSVDWKPDIDMTQFSKETSVDWKPENATSSGTGALSKQVKGVTNKAIKESTPKPEESQGKKQTRLGVEVDKDSNLSLWYSQVITKSEMIEYYNVSGCYILRPWSYAIWDFIKEYIDKEIKKTGVENSYFPIFVAKESLEKEKSHIADFSPEVAWVTRSGSSELAEPVAIRPTSETVMYPAFAKWIQSHRDLPMKLNQWNNVVRWEFKQPTPFLRTREFLWQEGHTAYATQEEAIEEVYVILDIYAQVYESLLAVPVVRGKKTEKEKFAGSNFTTTIEAFIKSSGRAIQAATSHHLGQNFSKMFNIVFEDPKTKEESFVYQNSWGFTTRSIGVMVMVHGDNKGLCLPPRVAGIQVIIVPVGLTVKTTNEDKEKLMASCQELNSELIAAGIRSKNDCRDNITPAWKFNHWELKGVPLRIEIGPREVSSGQVFVVRRDNGEKQHLNRSDISSQIAALLVTVHDCMFAKAKNEFDNHKIKVHQWQDFVDNLEKGNVLLAPFCGVEECEDVIKKDSAVEEPAEVGAPSMGAKGLCIPFDQPGDVKGMKCIHPKCSAEPKFYTLFGRSY